LITKVPDGRTVNLMIDLNSIYFSNYFDKNCNFSNVAIFTKINLFPDIPLVQLAAQEPVLNQPQPDPAILPPVQPDQPAIVLHPAPDQLAINPFLDL